MKLDVTIELRNYLSHFVGSPHESKRSLSEKIEDLFVGPDTVLLFDGKEYTSEDSESLMSVILHNSYMEVPIDYFDIKNGQGMSLQERIEELSKNNSKGFYIPELSKGYSNNDLVLIQMMQDVTDFYTNLEPK